MDINQVWLVTLHNHKQLAWVAIQGLNAYAHAAGQHAFTTCHVCPVAFLEAGIWQGLMNHNGDASVLLSVSYLCHAFTFLRRAFNLGLPRVCKGSCPVMLADRTQSQMSEPGAGQQDESRAYSLLQKPACGWDFISTDQVLTVLHS